MLSMVVFLFLIFLMFLVIRNDNTATSQRRKIARLEYQIQDLENNNQRNERRQEDERKR